MEIKKLTIVVNKATYLIVVLFPSFSFIKNYLIEDSNYLTFFTSAGSVKEIESKKLVFKKVNHKLFLDNKVGIIVSKKQKLKKFTEDFINLVKNEFDNSLDLTK